jgi:hypothetical protein
VAQYPLAHKKFPCDAVLAELIEKSASKTRFMRQQLEMDPDKYKKIDLDEMLHKIVGLYNNLTKRETLVKLFPPDSHNPVNFLSWTTYHGVFTDEDFFAATTTGTCGDHCQGTGNLCFVGWVG